MKIQCYNIIVINIQSLYKNLIGGDIMKKTERLTFLVTGEKKQEIERLAQEKGLSMSGLINLALAELIKIDNKIQEEESYVSD